MDPRTPVSIVAPAPPKVARAPTAVMAFNSGKASFAKVRIPLKALMDPDTSEFW
jgi:hypothetical protein